MTDSDLNYPEAESPTTLMTTTTDSPHHPEVESPRDRACAND